MTQAAWLQVEQEQSAHTQFAQVSPPQFAHEQVLWLQVSHEQSLQVQVTQLSEQLLQEQVVHSS